MGKCLLVAGGEYEPLKQKEEYDLVIACDKGYEHCLKMNLRPDLVIGDFDSCEKKPAEGIEVKKLNPIKDDTDTISAVRLALEKGFREIHICCAFGGRFDHSLANVQTAVFIAQHGGSAVIMGKDTTLYGLKNEKIELEAIENAYISVFAISDVCQKVTIKGTKYEIEKQDLTNAYPIGVSNEWTSEKASISVEKGILVVVVSKNVKIS